MIPIKRSAMNAADMAKLENAVAKSETNELNIEDITNAIVELGDLFAAQDDAIVELAEIIAEGE